MNVEDLLPESPLITKKSKQKFKTTQASHPQGSNGGSKDQEHTLTDLESGCPGSLLKATPPPPGYPWVSVGRYVTPELKLSGLVLDHQGLEELELKNHPKSAVYEQIWLFLTGFLALVLLKVDDRARNPYFWVLGSHKDHQTPMGTLMGTLGAVE